MLGLLCAASPSIKPAHQEGRKHLEIVDWTFVEAAHSGGAVGERLVSMATSGFFDFEMKSRCQHVLERRGDTAVSFPQIQTKQGLSF